MRLDGTMALTLLRGTHVAALLVLFGTLGFRALVVPRLGAAAPPADGLWRLASASAAAALVLGAAWFLAEAAVVSNASGTTALIGALPAVLTYLGFARLLALRIGLLGLLLAGLATTGAARLGGWRLAGLFGGAGVALGLQPWLSHAGAAGGRAGEILPWAELAHLLGAGLWLGGLPALGLSLSALADPAPAVHRFAGFALAAVLALAASGAAQAWFLVGGVTRFIDTAYGRTVLLKTVLFATALILALVNRLALSPRLDARASLGGARRRLRLSLAIEGLVGLATVLAAAFLAGLPPGADRAGTAPPWPVLVLPAAAALLAAVLAALRLSRRPPVQDPFPGVTSP